MFWETFFGHGELYINFVSFGVWVVSDDLGLYTHLSLTQSLPSSFAICHHSFQSTHQHDFFTLLYQEHSPWKIVFLMAWDLPWKLYDLLCCTNFFHNDFIQHHQNHILKIHGFAHVFREVFFRANFQAHKLLQYRLNFNLFSSIDSIMCSRYRIAKWLQNQNLLQCHLNYYNAGSYFHFMDDRLESRKNRLVFRLSSLQSW